MPEHAKLERDIEILAQHLGTEFEKPERREQTHKEVIRELVRERFNPAPRTPTPPPEAPVTGPSRKESSADEDGFLPSYAELTSPATHLKIEQLLDFAWHHGIREASRKAEQEGPFFLDAFHDALTEKLYDEFKGRGLIPQ